VEPTKETIRDGSYPVASEFYAVTAGPIGAPAPQEWNGYLKGFLDWILSEQGQRIIEETGYVALR
jgi:phosphate transport system substrate-binding protein